MDTINDSKLKKNLNKFYVEKSLWSETQIGHVLVWKWVKKYSYKISEIHNFQLSSLLNLLNNS